MNKHLKLVREFHDAFSFPQAEHGENVRLSEMAIILVALFSTYLSIGKSIRVTIFPNIAILFVKDSGYIS